MKSKYAVVRPKYANRRIAKNLLDFPNPVLERKWTVDPKPFSILSFL